MDRVRVLIVEDEPLMAGAIRDGLRLEAIAADIADDGDTALELLSLNSYDIAVLDRDIPGPSGDDIAQWIITSGSGMPILMLTAADRLDDKASGFELGADDYLTKPFELRELVLRLRALDRRRAHSRPPVREIAGLRLDPFRREVYRDGRYVALTRKQFAVLEVLIAAGGGVISAEEFLSGPGMRTLTRSPTRCGSPYPRCVSDWDRPGLSRPCPASATASAPDRTPTPGRPSVARAPGLSVRLKLTLSYAGFLMVAGFLLLVAVGYSSCATCPLHEFVFASPGATPHSGPSRRGLLADFIPTAAIALAVLLVLGLVGGWFLAGRMLAPLTRITDATRVAATGSLSHRIELEGRQDEFRELADSFDVMLAQLEAHVGEQKRFAANASHELRTPLAITQSLLDVARNDPNHNNDELVQRLHAVNTRAIDLTEALLLLSRADQRSFTREPVDLSLVAEEATETLLPLAEKRGVSIRTTGVVTTAAGSHALLLQMTMNLIHNAIVHNLAEQGTVWVTTNVQGDTVELAVENTGQRLTPQMVSLLEEPFQRGTQRVHTDHGGVGLGLAIVKSITRAHEGTLVLLPRPAGGLRAIVQLPIAPDDASARSHRDESSSCDSAAVSNRSARSDDSGNPYSPSVCTR